MSQNQQEYPQAPTPPPVVRPDQPEEGEPLQ